MSQVLKTSELSPNTTKTKVTEEPTRSLCIRKVPESLWNRLHINAIKNRMRLNSYLIEILKQNVNESEDSESVKEK